MKVIKKLLTIGLTFIFMFCINGVFVSCAKSGKYDVTIRIACDDGETWEFTPDVDEIRVERDYDGEEHRYYVDAYKLSDHPKWSNKWLEPKGEGADVFNFDMLFTDMNGEQDGKLRTVKNQGEYAIIVEANATSTLWKYRSVILYVTVK